MVFSKNNDAKHYFRALNVLYNAVFQVVVTFNCNLDLSHQNFNKTKIMKEVSTTKTTKQIGTLRQRWNSRKQLNNSRLTAFRSILALTLILISISCSKDDSIIEPQNPVVINSISPTSGPKATVVIISGNNFGEDQNTVQVFFNGKEATVQSVTNTAIVTIVPPKAFTGHITIKINGEEITGPEFEYELTVLVSTLAGSTKGDVDGTGTAAKFDTPARAVLDAQGNLYLTDFGNSKIKIISPEGEVSTFAGSSRGFTDGPSTTAQFSRPVGIVMDEIGNFFVADRGNHCIRKILPSGEVSTIAGGVRGFVDGIGTAARFNEPSDLAIDGQSNLYVSDANNHKIRKIDPRGHVSTLAGSIEGFEDGSATEAKFNRPTDVVVDHESNLYVTDARNNRIRKIAPDGTVTTLAGSAQGFQDGVLAEALFDNPSGLAIDTLGNLYVADFTNHRIRKISVDGTVSTLAGSVSGSLNGSGAEAQFALPYGLVVDAEHNVYVMDAHNHRIRKITQE